MNELQSALGLLQLKHIDQALARRQAIDRQDRERSVICLERQHDEREANHARTL